MHKGNELDVLEFDVDYVYFDPTLKRSVAMTAEVITFGYCTDYFSNNITRNKKMQYDIC